MLDYLTKSRPLCQSLFRIFLRCFVNASECSDGWLLLYQRFREFRWFWDLYKILAVSCLRVLPIYKCIRNRSSDWPLWRMWCRRIFCGNSAKAPPSRQVSASCQRYRYCWFAIIPWDAEDVVRYNLIKHFCYTINKIFLLATTGQSLSPTDSSLYTREPLKCVNSAFVGKTRQSSAIQIICLRHTSSVSQARHLL